MSMPTGIPDNALFVCPDAAITLVNDCGIKKGPPTQYTPDDLETTVAAIVAALEAGEPVL
jgi:hypothetical protein